MLNLSQEQIDDRYDSLPEVLKDVLWSVATADEISRIGEEHHLEDQKVSRLAKVIGYVIMGFLHPDDLRRELQEVLGVDIRVAASLSREINKRILYPIRDEIRKVYTPIVTEIKRAPPMSSQTWPTPSQTRPMPPAEEILKAASPLTTSPSQISEKLGRTSQQPAPPSPPPISPPPTVKPGKPFDKAQGKPFILHREESLKPVLETRVPPAETTTFKTPSPPPSQKPVTAELELGPKIKKEEAPHIVHYSELRTPIKPTTDDQRLTTDDKRGTTVPPKPPVPPQPTTPVTPPTAEKKTEAEEEKVIDLRSFKIIR